MRHSVEHAPPTDPPPPPAVSTRPAPGRSRYLARPESWHDSEVSVPATSARLIGRGEDLALLRELFAEAAAGDTRTVVVGGEAGIGKTRLLTEFINEVRPGALVLRGQAVDQGSVPAPYSPITGLLKSLRSQCGPDAIRDAAGSGLDTLASLLPSLGPVASTPEDSYDHDARGAGRLHETLTLMFETLSLDRPLVLVVEDLHWADGATLQLLGFLVRALVHDRILLLLSYRSDDVPRGHPLRAFLGELDRTRRVQRHELTRLSLDQVGEQVVGILGTTPDRGDLERVYERSEGVPFFVEELVGIAETGTAEDLPDTLRALLLGRYDRLDPTTQLLLRVLSVGGVRVDHRLVSAVFEGGADALDAAAREAVGANVLVADERYYTFRHALVREAIYADLLPGERIRFHTAFAEAIEALGTEVTAWAEVSNHWMSARNFPRAFPATKRAMDNAYTASGYVAVAQFGERLLELWDQVEDPETGADISRLELMYQTACALNDAGDLERSAVLVDHALNDPTIPSDTLRAKLLRTHSQHLSRLGRPGTRAPLEEALSLLPAGTEPRLHALVLNDLAGEELSAGNLDRARDYAERAMASATEAGSPYALSAAAGYAGTARVMCGDIEEGLALFARAEEVAAGDAETLLRYRVAASDVHFRLGHYALSTELALAGVRDAKAVGMERSSGLVLASNAVDPLLAMGLWDEAHTIIEDTLALRPALAYSVYLRTSKILLVLWRGDPERAAALLARWRPQLDLIGSQELHSRFTVAAAVAQVSLSTGDLREAWASLDVLRDARHRPIPGYDLPLLPIAARVLACIREELRQRAEHGVSLNPHRILPEGISEAELDRQERAWRTLLPAYESWPTTKFWVAAFEAELGEPGGTGENVAAWRALVAATDSPAAPARYLPYAQLRLGTVLLEHGDRAGAQQALDCAVSEARALGAHILEQHALESAHRGGLAVDGHTRVRRTRETDELTARERQVLTLIAEGLNNRQIGERLFISTKTASVHVSAILRKLGVASRTEAAVHAGAAGLLG